MCVDRTPQGCLRSVSFFGRYILSQRLQACSICSKTIKTNTYQVFRKLNGSNRPVDYFYRFVKLLNHPTTSIRTCLFFFSNSNTDCMRNHRPTISIDYVSFTQIIAHKYVHLQIRSNHHLIDPLDEAQTIIVDQVIVNLTARF